MGRIRRAAISVEYAGHAAARTARAIERMVEVAEGVLEEVQDGIHCKLIIDGSLKDLLTGQIKELPIRLQIDLLEPEEKNA